MCNKANHQPRKLYANSQIEIGNFVYEPTTSIPKVVVATNILVGSISKPLKMNKFSPNKILIQQQLSEDDFDRRAEFCEQMSQRIEDDQNLTTQYLL